MQARMESDNGLLSLTPREKEVFRLIAEGMQTKEIVEKLGVSKKTAETHRNNLMYKIGLISTADLTRYALQKGLISSNKRIENN